MSLVDILVIIMMIGTFAGFIGVPLTIYFLVKVFSATDVAEKGKYKRNAMISFFGPALLLVVPVLIRVAMGA